MRSHSWQEDLFALISSVALISLGIVLFKQAGLVVGGTMGLALLLQKTTSLSFGTWFFIINLPFYLIGFKKMGKVFVRYVLRLSSQTQRCKFLGVITSYSIHYTKLYD